MASASPSDAPTGPAGVVLDLVAGRPATLGSGRLVCVDGPAGSGKTTLATELASAAAAPLIHTDDLIEGWDGLPGLPATLEALFGQLAQDRPGEVPHYDWDAGRFTEPHTQEPVPLLVVVGVGSGTLPAARWATVLVWVDAPYDLRMHRGLERDGEAFAPHWTAWAEAEARHFAEQRTRERADVVVDGTGAAPPLVRR